MRKLGALALRRPAGWVSFFIAALVWMVVLTLAWSKVSPWTSWPVGALAGFALEQGAPMWVRSVHHTPGTIEVDTTIEKALPGAAGRVAELTVEADPGRYAYGLPIFLALLLAARSRGLAARALAGYLLLLPAQAFSLSMLVLMQMVLYAQTSTRVLRVPQWQMDAIVYGYQVGSLVVPTLVPIMVWLWLDRRFFNDVVVRGWRPGAANARDADADWVQPVSVPDVQTIAEPAQAPSAAQALAQEPPPPPSSAGRSHNPAMRPKKPNISSSADAGLPGRR